MQHLGLFEGIGGFSLAARWAGWHTPVMVEWDHYCQFVLKKNFPNAVIYGDIKQFDGRPYAGKIDIITGGFPCQPFSSAGKRAGTNDDRYLWPEMLRIIQEVKPAWVVGENVAGLITMDGGRVLESILANLENAGYIAEIYLIPAIGVGAPHRRERVWIVAHSTRANDRRNAGELSETDGRQKRNQFSKFTCANKIPTPHANSEGLQKRESQPGHNGTKQPAIIGNVWREHWFEVATRICGMDDGIPSRVDGIGNVPGTRKKGKAQRLKALGNAIVPQIAYQIFQAINEHETTKHHP